MEVRSSVEEYKLCLTDTRADGTRDDDCARTSVKLRKAVGFGVTTRGTVCELWLQKFDVWKENGRELSREDGVQPWKI